MDYESEADLVRAFGAAIDSWPKDTLFIGAHKIVIFAHELSLEGAGPNGSAGSADIVAVDDLGEVWIIEAKLARNPQSNPYYAFGNQLARYGYALATTQIQKLHTHIQDYAYGRRHVLQPPEKLAPAWRNVRDLEGMLEQWLNIFGNPTNQTGKSLVQTVSDRISRGHFVLALLTDQPTRHQEEWINRNENQFETALLTIDNDRKIRIIQRTKPVEIDAELMGKAIELPPFDQIPQSFNPTPETFGLVLNDTAYKLFADIAFPILVDAFGEKEASQPRRSARSGASFGYCLRNKFGLPINLMFGRGDHRLHRGNISPGEHTLKLDINLKWACSILSELSEERKKAAIEDLWNLYSQLKACSGYGIKNSSSVRTLEQVTRGLFDQQTEKGDLRLERWIGHGKKDFGNDPDDFENDARCLEGVLNTVLECCEGPLYKLIDRPKRTSDSKKETKSRNDLPSHQPPSMAVLTKPEDQAFQINDNLERDHEREILNQLCRSEYWLFSDQGRSFFITGIPIKAGYLVPDKAVMKRFLRDGFITIDWANKKFILLDKGMGLVRQVLEKAKI